MTLKIILLQLLFISTALTENIPPTIIRWTSKQQAYVPPSGGESMTCEAKGTGDLLFGWFHNGQKITTSDKARYQHTRKVNVGSTVETLKIILNNAQLDPKDEGFYQCKVASAYGTALSDVMWLRRHFNGLGTDPKDMRTNEGDYLLLQCPETQQSVPRPKVEWMITSSDDVINKPLVMDSRLQINVDGTLVFSYVMMNDKTETGSVESYYTCILINPIDGVSKVMASRYGLVVEKSTASPPTSLTTLFTYVEPQVAVVGGDVLLGCFFGGDQTISVVWKDANGNTPVKIGDSDITYPSTSSMKIARVKKGHMGKYSCIGRSGGGYERREELTIQVQEKPTFLEKPQDQTANIGSNAEFRCNANADPPANIEWFMNGNPISEDKLPEKMYLTSDKKTLGIQNVCKEKCPLGRSDLMVIQCNASNVHGYAFANGYLNVLFKTEITKGPSDVIYNSAQNATFYCEAVTDPDTTLTYRWLLNDDATVHDSINTLSKTLFLDLPNMPDKGWNLRGKWTCVASNKYSNDAKSAFLKDEAAPDAPDMSRIRMNFARDVEAMLNKQVNIELHASYVYQSMAAYFNRDDVALKGCEKFFHKMSDEEREHAEKIINYINKRGGSIVLQNVEKPKKDKWGSCLEAMESALQLEKAVNQNLLDIHKVATSREDPHLSNWLEEEFLREQVESMYELSSHITNLKRVGVGLGEYMFDKETLDS